MNVSELLVEAGILMLVGMAVVFVFLTILIFATKTLTKFALAFPEPEQAAPAKPVIKPIHSENGAPSPQIIAAISAAVKQYRNKNK